MRQKIPNRMVVAMKPGKKSMSVEEYIEMRKEEAKVEERPPEETAPDDDPAISERGV